MIGNAIADLKEALKGSDADAITAKTNALAQASMKLYAALFVTTRPSTPIDLSKLGTSVGSANQGSNLSQGSADGYRQDHHHR